MTWQMRGIMEQSRLGAATPYPVPGLAAPRVLVMTRLFGHKVRPLFPSLLFLVLFTVYVDDNFLLGD